MWNVIRTLRESGVTIILTTHYIEEAEQMADRVGVINRGKIVLVEDKDKLMLDLGQKQMTLQLLEPLTTIPNGLSEFALELSPEGDELVYTYDTATNRTGITSLLSALADEGIRFGDLDTVRKSLEEIFVDLVNREHP